MTTPTPQPGILDIAAYVGGESKIQGVSEVIKLSSNEGAFGPSPKAISAMEEAAVTSHLYPDGGANGLRTALAGLYGLDKDRIVCSAGSDEIISLLCQAYAGPGDEIVHSAHGFLMYSISAKAAGATPKPAPETDLTANVDALLAQVTDQTKILFLANPNNPTGTYLPKAEVKRLRDELRDDVLLVLDAAYAEFVASADYEAGIELVEATDNTVMTRTFSKIYGLGGVRLGWCYGPPAIIDVLNRVRGPFNVSGVALAAGEAAAMDTAFTAKCVAHNDEWLKRTRDALRQLGLFIPDGVGNFVLVQFPDHPGKRATDANAFLKDQGIIVRQMDGYGLTDCLRISIGPAAHMERLITAMRDFMGADE